MSGIFRIPPKANIQETSQFLFNSHWLITQHHIHYLTLSDTATELLIPMIHTFNRTETRKRNKLKRRRVGIIQASLIKNSLKSHTQQSVWSSKWSSIFIHNLRHPPNFGAKFSRNFSEMSTLNLQTFSCDLDVFKVNLFVKSGELHPPGFPPLWALWLSSAPRLLHLV